MDTTELLELIEELETKDEMKSFGEETFGLSFTTRETVEQVKQKLIDAASGKMPEEKKPEPKQEAPKQPPQEAPKELEGRRLLKHKANGRIFPWSEKLAKNKNLYEVR